MRVRRYPTIVVFLIAGAFAIVLAYATLNLVQVGMANIRFLREFGLTAVMEGALVQLAQIVVTAFMALISWIGFKICEGELIRRYFQWQDR